MDELRKARADYQAGLTSLGELLSALNRFLDAAPEEDEHEAPPPAPVAAKTVVKGKS